MNTTLYALRHKATGHLMPALRGHGYSNWAPTEADPKGSLAEAFDVPRLFATFKGADNSRVLWAQGVRERMYVGDGPDGYDTVSVKDVGRKKDDLEVIPMMLTLADRAVVHIKFSQQACVEMMRDAFNQTLVEFQEVSADAIRLQGLYEMLAEHTKQPELTLRHNGAQEWSLSHNKGTTWTASIFEKVIDNAVRDVRVMTG